MIAACMSFEGAILLILGGACLGFALCLGTSSWIPPGSIPYPIVVVCGLAAFVMVWFLWDWDGDE